MECFNGIPVRVVPAERKIQNRKHKKKRMSKKYLKRYGFTTVPSIVEDGKIIATPLMIVMNENTYQNFKKFLEDKDDSCLLCRW